MLAAAAVALQAAPQPVSVAVFDFSSRDGSTKELGPNLSALLTAHLSAEGDLILVERAELEKGLGEQELGLSGTVAPDTAATVGNLTGAKVLVTGSVFKADKNLMVVAKVIGTETGRVYGTTGKMNAAGGDLSELAEELAAKVGSTIKEKADTLLAKAEPREERVKRLVAKAKTTEPLAVSVASWFVPPIYSRN